MFYRFIPIGIYPVNFDVLVPLCLKLQSGFLYIIADSLTSFIADDPTYP